jgi:hypothetical protein
LVTESKGEKWLAISDALYFPVAAIFSKAFSNAKTTFRNSARLFRFSHKFSKSRMSIFP